MIRHQKEKKNKINKKLNIKSDYQKKRIKNKNNNQK